MRTASVKAVVDAGVAVMGHIGLTPQSISVLGGFGPQGKTAAAALRAVRDAKVGRSTASLPSSTGAMQVAHKPSSPLREVVA